jgi:hypothetical protein
VRLHGDAGGTAAGAEQKQDRRIANLAHPRFDLRRTAFDDVGGRLKVLSIGAACD